MMDQQLSFAFKQKNKLLCLTLLASMKYVDAKDENESTALHQAADHGWIDVCDILIDRGANIDAVNGYGWRPLHIASFRGHIELCRALLDRGADIQAITQDEGESALHIAAYLGNEVLCELLLNRGVSLEVKNAEGLTALSVSSICGKTNVCLFLIGNSAVAPKKLNTAKKIRKLLKLSPLQAAATLGDCALVNRIIDEDAEPDTLPERIIQAVRNSQIAKKPVMTAFLQSWQAHHAISQLTVKMSAHKKSI